MTSPRELLRMGGVHTTSHIALLQVSPQPCGRGFSTVFSHTLCAAICGQRGHKVTHGATGCIVSNSELKPCNEE